MLVVCTVSMNKATHTTSRWLRSALICIRRDIAQFDMKGLPIFWGQVHEQFCAFEEGAQLIFISNISGWFGLGGIAKSVSDAHGICFFFHYCADFPQKLVYGDV